MAPGPAPMPVAAIAAVPQYSAESVAGKKKRKPHDRNAPKRALTSYFLFMQHNKPQIKEVHPDWTAGQISEESEKRWVNISEKERAVSLENACIPMIVLTVSGLRVHVPGRSCALL